MSIFTPGMGDPEGERMVQRTRIGMPEGSEERGEPGERCGAVWVWKGPRMEPEVLWGGLGWSRESTSRERPRMSERRMNSWFGGDGVSWWVFFFFFFGSELGLGD
jgi:hypothetical protein